ncbi:MAG: hypothetical protein M1144_02115 [Candidatus Thermoplasmatota archaeon]|jgi:5-methyltetrahydropteroyltriglutamate--homocysteine methyltransferase|nr:hypothetical protein [Candidatus Thermoplasmatota archaeon]MCL5984521.1 hypothetical protein [Candidatus Thermoplasmatota archaeon]
MQTEAGTTTFLPRPEELVTATRELDRGRRSREEVDKLVTKWTGEVYRVEDRLHFAWKTGGHLSWQDLFRPIIDSSDGMVAGALTRWFETNTFFRRPVIEDLPRLRAGAFAQHLPPPEQRLALILPGPWTFAGLAENRTGKDLTEVASALTTLLHDLTLELLQKGVQHILLHEPLLAYADEVPEAELTQLYHSLTEGIAPERFLIWTYFGDGSWLLPQASKLRVSGVGVDLAETPLSNLTRQPVPKGVTLGLGCIDSRTSLPEDPKDIQDVLQKIGEGARPERVLLGPSSPLDLLPWETAVTKLSVLGEVLGRSG